jgi:broad specificity phosphatase PhoE
MIYLMRHGQTIWNAERRLQGRMDSPLTALGAAQAKAFGERLATIFPDPSTPRAVASPLGRAWQTAVLAVDAMGGDPASIELEDRLMEHAFGLWEGLQWADVERDHAESVAVRLADKWNAPAPEGESYSDVAVRAGEWLRENETAGPTLVFCHGVTARVLRGLYGGLPQAEIMTLPEPQDRIFKLADGRIEEISV